MAEFDFTPSADAPPVLKPAKRGLAAVPVWAWIALAAAGVLVVGVGIVGLVIVANATADANRTMSREEFDKKVIGKTRDEIIAAVGRPDETDDKEGASTPTWVYKRRTHDAISGKVDDRRTVRFCLFNWGTPGVVTKSCQCSP